MQALPTALLGRSAAKVRWIRGEVLQGKVVLAAETAEFRVALAEASGLPFVYLPQPVPAQKDNFVQDVSGKEQPLFACYGPARHEKGSDLLQEAIKCFLARNPQAKLEFVIHWTSPFTDAKRREICPDQDLERDPRVTFLKQHLTTRKYLDWLSRTDLMLLPYRASSYDLRGSRVAVEAMVDGIPMVITGGTAAAKQASSYGAAVFCNDDDVEDLVRAIAAAAENLPALTKTAATRMQDA